MLFTFEGNIQCAIKVLRLAMDHADGDKCKIVFTSPEAMMEFSVEKKYTWHKICAVKSVEFLGSSTTSTASLHLNCNVERKT